MRISQSEFTVSIHYVFSISARTHQANAAHDSIEISRGTLAACMPMQPYTTLIQTEQRC